MNKHILTGITRTITGRKVKQLRAQGNLPATVYGKSVESLSITLKENDFKTVYKAVGETGLIELSISEEKNARPVLIHTVQVHPVTGKIQHIEFHQVNLREKVTASVPVMIVGDAPAVTNKLGVLLTLVNTLDVEALPAELPEHISVEVTSLAALNDEIKVKDLKISANVHVIAEPEIVIARISPVVVQVEETPTPETVVIGETAATDATAEADGEKSAAPDKKE